MEYIFAKEEYRRLRHCFYGCSPQVIARLRNVLTSRFGDFNLVWTYSPPMKPLGFVEEEDVLSRIRGLAPHFLWVGLSCPKQELWMQMHMPLIGSGVAIGVGAAFDLVSGTKFQAPRWIQRSGLEWLFRLLTEPKRLFKRYFFVIPRFLYFLLEALVKHRSEMWRKANRRNPS